MEKNKYKYGEDHLIYHLQNWIKMIKDILNLIENIIMYNHNHYQEHK